MDGYGWLRSEPLLGVHRIESPLPAHSVVGREVRTTGAGRRPAVQPYRSHAAVRMCVSDGW